MLTGLMALVLLSIVALYIIVIPNVREDQITGDEKSESIKKTQTKQSAVTRIQNNKWIYLGYKLDSLGEVVTNFQETYKSKMDSINLVLESVFYKMERMDDRLTAKDEQLEEATEENADGLSSLKRSTARDFRKIRKEASNLKGDLEELKKIIDKIKPDALYTDEELLEMQEEQNNQ